MNLKTTLFCTFTLFASLLTSAWAAPEDESLIQRAIEIAKVHPGFMKDLILQDTAEIQVEIKNNKSTDWRKAQLISKFEAEAEKELATIPLVALIKINFVLDAANKWRSDLNHWNQLVLVREGRVLLMKSLIEKNQTDQKLASEKFELSDELADSKEKGHGVYMHGAAYETLASIANTMRRPREEQIALIKKGIQVNMHGQKKYPSYSYGVSLDALYGKFQFVTGGVSAEEYVDEWIAFVKTKSVTDQGFSGESIAGALFSIQRDAEAIEWTDRYIDYRKKLLSSPNLAAFRQTNIVEACSPSMLGGFNFSFRSLATRAPRLLETLNKKLCSALSEIE
jgi:hypothetical protein